MKYRNNSRVCSAAGCSASYRTPRRAPQRRRRTTTRWRRLRRYRPTRPSFAPSESSYRYHRSSYRRFLDSVAARWPFSDTGAPASASAAPAGFQSPTRAYPNQSSSSYCPRRHWRSRLVFYHHSARSHRRFHSPLARVVPFATWKKTFARAIESAPPSSSRCAPQSSSTPVHTFSTTPQTTRVLLHSTSRVSS